VTVVPSPSENGSLLAARLGVTTHVSPLRFKLRSLQRRYPSAGASCIEDWLIDVANSRGARIVVREPKGGQTPFSPPPEGEFPNSELIAALCMPRCLDRPQMLRLAAQLITRRAATLKDLRLAALRERTDRVLAELARQAVRVDPGHPLWKALLDAFGARPGFHEPVLHWTRLAEPVMAGGRCNAGTWRLVS